MSLQVHTTFLFYFYLFILRKKNCEHWGISCIYNLSLVYEKLFIEYLNVFTLVLISLTEGGGNSTLFKVDIFKKSSIIERTISVVE